MKIKVLIIGSKSFLGSNLYVYLKKKKIDVTILSFDKAKIKKLHMYSNIINCSSNKKYINNTYDKKNDYDLIISNKIINSQTKLIFISSRKVYKNAYNLSEKSKIETKDHYSKNKYNSEKKLIFLLNNRVLILRVANVIGLPIKKNDRRKVHNTFIDIFKKNINKGFILKNNNIYKDFIGIQKFSEIIHKIIVKKVEGGIYNISLGKKVYVNDIANIKTIKMLAQKIYSKDKEYLSKHDLHCVLVKNYLELYNEIIEISN